MDGRGRLWRHVFVAVVGAALVATALAAPAMAAAGKKKFYAASMISASPAPENNKDALFGGQSVDLAITITNQTSSQQPLGSANVTIPTAVTPVSLVSVTTSPVARDWSISSLNVAGRLLQLRNPGPNTSNALQPGESVTAVVRVTTGCDPNTLSTWVTQTKQSNDFSGTGNDFTLVGSYPTSNVKVGCPYHLSFDRQPSSTTAGQPIDASLAPAGITVDILDSADQLVTIATNPVSMAIGTNPSGGTLYGTTTVSAVAGVATFSDLAIDLAGTGYTLVASSAGIASGTSNAFNITGVATSCSLSGNCHGSTGTKATATDPTVGTADVPVNSCGQTVCFLSLDEATGAFCNGTCIANTVTFVPPTNENAVGTVTIEIYKTLLPGNLGSVNVYKQAPDGTVTLLSDCSQTVTAPCVASRTHVNQGNGLFTISVGPNDPVFGTR